MRKVGVGGRSAAQGLHELISLSPLDRLLARFHAFVFARFRFQALLLAYLSYAGVVLGLGDRLAISANYFVLLPVLFAGVGYGLPGGLLAGILALPSNLLLFGLIGHPEFSPASKPIAELSGVFVGTALGYLSEYFSRLAEEIRRRARVEEELRRAVAEKAALLSELEHRVKNNLNLVKSLVQLQKNRCAEPLFRAAADELLGRVFAIALVQERLVGESGIGTVEAGDFLCALASNAASVRSGAEISFRAAGGSARRRLSADEALPLGLVVNEALAEASRAAGPVTVHLSERGDELLVRVEDEGSCGGEEPGLAGCRDDEGRPGLGATLVEALARQLRATARTLPREGGGRVFELSFAPGAARP